MVSKISSLLTAILFAAISGFMVCPAWADDEPKSFATTEEASQAFRAAIGNEDTDGLLDLFGRQHKDLVLGTDPAVGRVERRRVAAIANEKMTTVRHGQSEVILVLGKGGWPMPIPLMRIGDRWSFNTKAGEGEILARRIGGDELGAISTLKVFVTAQHVFAKRLQAAGKPMEFARFVQSTEDDADGLWWNDSTVASDGASPLATFADSHREFLEGRHVGAPFHGYYFRILTAQGLAAPGGAKSYLVGGRMVKGFALIAWPADYRASGITTFIVGSSGKISQADLGEDTSSIVQGILQYNPDRGWTPIP